MSEETKREHQRTSEKNSFRVEVYNTGNEERERWEDIHTDELALVWLTQTSEGVPALSCKSTISDPYVCELVIRGLCEVLISNPIPEVKVLGTEILSTIQRLHSTLPEGKHA